MKVPTTLVCTKSAGPSIERSTWLSVARCITASGSVGREDLPHRGCIGDIGPDQDMTIVSQTFLKRVLGRGVGHLVDIDHGMIGVAQQITHDGGADKST